MHLLKYLKSVLTHKYYVFIAGIRVGAPIRNLIFHDWTKFLPDEFFPYARYFYGDSWSREEFDRAWLKHLHRNRHHPQHWILRNDNDGTYALEMSWEDVKEMVADWMGATRTYQGTWDMSSWLRDNLKNRTESMDERTVSKVYAILTLNGYEDLDGDVKWQGS